MRYKGCLIGVAAAAALFAAVAVVVGPSLVREVRRALAPIRRIRTAQTDFERWVQAHPWKDPATSTLDEKQLTTFLALRKEIARLDDEIRRRPEAQGSGRRPSIADVPEVLEGVGGLVAQRTSAYERAGMTPAEYTYVERLVYQRWLLPLTAEGEDPAARDKAAEEIERAARSERDGAVAAGLRRVAGELRSRPLPAPQGVPPEVHALLTRHAREIEALAGSHRPPPRGRRGGIRLETN